MEEEEDDDNDDDDDGGDDDDDGDSGQKLFSHSVGIDHLFKNSMCPHAFVPTPTHELHEYRASLPKLVFLLLTLHFQSGRHLSPDTATGPVRRISHLQKPPKPLFCPSKSFPQYHFL